MTREEAEQTLTRLGCEADERFDLLEAAVACALHEGPGRDAIPTRRLVEEAADRLAERIMQVQPEEALGDVLSGEFRLAGDLAGYDRPENSDILSVTERRRGLPVAIAVFYIAAARRCGLGVVGIDFPGHFLLRVDTHEGPVALDPFNHGRVVSPLEMTSRAVQAGVSDAPSAQPEGFMIGMSDRAVAIRLENNIYARALAAEDYGRAERSALRRALMNSKDHRAWVDVATARESQGALTSALAALAKAERLDSHTLLLAESLRARVRMKLN